VLVLLPGLLFALVAVGPAGAQDKTGKAPLGTWKKSDDKITVTIGVTEKAATVTIKSEKLNLDFEADYGVSGGGKTVYACIRKMKEGDEKLVGELFGFELDVSGEELTLSKFKGTGAVALGGFFMNGKYKKEPSKKD
jgi:hypothetical protein